MGGSGPHGYGMIPRWLLYDESVSAHAKLVYVVLQSHSGKHGTSFPAIGTVARESGLSESSVRRAIKDLKDIGVLERRGRRRRTGATTSNEYAIRTHL